MTLHDAVIAHREWQQSVIEDCCHMLEELQDEEQQELKAAWFARKTHAENTLDRLTTILESSE